MKIDELPPELLMKIFSHLSTYKRVSLASRKFYEVACRVNDTNVSLTLNRRLLHLADNTLQSIEESNRKISKVEICLLRLTKVDLLRLLSIISRFSETIKYLRIDAPSIEMDFLINILSLVPNAEHFSLKALRVIHTVKMSIEECLDLKHLRVLELIGCENLFRVLFNRLPEGVITELQFLGDSLFSLNTFVSRQTNIKKLSLEDCKRDVQLTSQILNNLELESLKIENSVVEKASLSKQKKLKSLTLIDDCTSNVMEVVANSFIELEELNWEIRGTISNDFVNIQRLKNLKHLKLLFRRHHPPEILDGLSQLDNSRIVTLEFSGFDILRNHQIRTLATSAPKLKVIRCELNTAFLKRFDFFGILSFDRGFDRFEGNYENYLNQSESGNAKLAELSFPMKQYEPSVLRKVIADFPNLKKLRIVSENNIVSSHFRLIVDGFTKLESLDLNCGNQLTIDDFNYLRNNSKRLQILWLRQMSEAYVQRHLEDLEAIFEVVKYSHHCKSLLLKF